MRSELGDKIRLQHILDAIEEIQKYLIAVDFPIHRKFNDAFCMYQANGNHR